MGQNKKSSLFLTRKFFFLFFFGEKKKVVGEEGGGKKEERRSDFGNENRACTKGCTSNKDSFPLPEVFFNSESKYINSNKTKTKFKPW